MHTDLIRQHLPEALFLDCERYQLLDETVHSCPFGTVQVHVIRVKDPVHECAELVFKTHSPKDEGVEEMTYCFRNRIFWLAGMLDCEGVDYVFGNRYSCPFDPKSEEELKKMTPELVRKLKSVLDDYMKEEVYQGLCGLL